VISWFQSFAFKWVNLCRSIEYSMPAADKLDKATVAGLYKSNAVDPELESARFQLLSL
jgi:hypothetical protein